MAKRKNSLPSGNFRVLALDYTDRMVNVIISPLPRRPRKRRGCLQTNGNYQRKGTAPKIYPFVSLSSDTRT